MFRIYSIIWHTTNSCYHLIIEFRSLITEAEQLGLKNSTKFWSKLIENDMIKRDHKVRNFCLVFC